MAANCCGMAAATLETQLVEDVHAFHLAEPFLVEDAGAAFFEGLSFDGRCYLVAV